MTRRRRAAPAVRTRAIETSPSLEARLQAKVDRTGGPSACWPFTGKRQNGGYGVLAVSSAPFRTIYAHRLAHMIATGSDPLGKAVCHRCDNPPCCNPAHLFLGTIRDNVHDMIAKGRASIGRWGHPPLLKGEQCGAAKVTEAVVREIRRRASIGETSATLGRAYGLDSSSVRQIVRRDTWAHVTDTTKAAEA